MNPISAKASLVRLTAVSALLLFQVIAAHANSVISLGNLSAPGAYTYGISYSQPQASFSDLITFSLPDSFFNNGTTTFELGNFLGISNLQTTLYAGTLTPSGSIDPGASVVASATGIPLMASGIEVGAVAQLNTLHAGAGNYILNIQGTVFGIAGGAFSGVMNVSPVPEPDSMMSLLAGLGLIATCVARRRKA